MSLVDQWREIERSLPEGWPDARLELIVADQAECERAAALLGPANPGRTANRIRFYSVQGGVGIGPAGIARLLRRIDRENIEGELALVSATEPEPAREGLEPSRPMPSLAESWDELVAGLPEDWSDLYIELALSSSDHLEPAALAAAPLNPARYGERPGFRFRCASRFGYGAAPDMVRRCLERLDEERIAGEIRLLRALSDTKPVGTQGPVWYVGGHSV